MELRRLCPAAGGQTRAGPKAGRSVLEAVAARCNCAAALKAKRTGNEREAHGKWVARPTPAGVGGGQSEPRRYGGASVARAVAARCSCAACARVRGSDRARF